MSVVTKWSIPVATLAITLLTVYLPAQCEKLSTLKQDSVHRRQTVLHTSLGSIRWYQSDEMWLCRSVLYVHRGKGKSCASITHLVFQGTPVDSAPWKRAYPKQLALNSALLWHHLQSGDRRRVFAPGKMTTAGISRTSWCHFCFLCSVTHGFLVQVCKDKQTGCEDELQGRFHGHENNQTTTKLQVQDDEATSVMTTKSGCCVYYSWATRSLALPQSF